MLEMHGGSPEDVVMMMATVDLWCCVQHPIKFLALRCHFRFVRSVFSVLELDIRVCWISH